MYTLDMTNSSRRLDARRLRPSGALLAAQIALGAAIESCAVEGLGHDATIIDLLVRLDLAPDRTLRAVDISAQLLLSPSHISRMLDRAEEAELIERRPDPTDRRASLVTLTRTGSDVVAEFAPRLHAVLEHTIFAELDADEIDTLVGLLERIETRSRSCPSMAGAE